MIHVASATTVHIPYLIMLATSMHAHILKLYVVSYVYVYAGVIINGYYLYSLAIVAGMGDQYVATCDGLHALVVGHK